MHIAVFNTHSLFLISSCIFPSQIPVPWQSPNTRTISEKLLGLISLNIFTSTSELNIGSPMSPVSQPFNSSALISKAVISLKSDSTFSSSKLIIFAFTPVISSSLFIIVSISLPSVPNFSI